MLRGERRKRASALCFYCNLVSGSGLANTESVFKSVHYPWEHRGQFSPDACGNQTGEKELKVRQEGLGLDIQEYQHRGNYNQQRLGIASSQGGF